MEAPTLWATGGTETSTVLDCTNGAFAPIRHDEHGSSIANGTVLDNLGCRERYELPEAVVFGG